MTSFSRFLSAFIYVIQRRDPLCIPQGPDLLLTFWKRPAGGALPLGRLCSSVREEGGCGVQMGKIMPHHMLPSFNAVLRDHWKWLRYPQLHGHFTLFWVGLEVSAQSDSKNGPSLGQIRLGFKSGLIKVHPRENTVPAQVIYHTGILFQYIFHLK